jgi:endonuclease/exonuclease/phosphatase family metal-dependent hydrolase
MTGLRVLHWNVHSWLDTDRKPNGERVADLINRTAPDVVSLAEVDEPHGTRGNLAEIAASSRCTSIFCPAFEFGGKDGPQGAFGNALLARVPILAVRHRHLLWPVPSYDGSEESEARTVTLADLDTGLGPVTAGTTHLPRGNPTARDAAIARLVDVVTGSARWFIAGDFNTPPSWMEGHEFAVAPDAVPTYPVGDPVEAIDYIITAAPLRVRAEVLDEPGSDHFPVLAIVSRHEDAGITLR